MQLDVDMLPKRSGLESLSLSGLLYLVPEAERLVQVCGAV